MQHLQSGGDKTLEKYLISGRPAVVLLDLAAILAADLFDAEPLEHLVLGQLFYRHRSAPDKIDRIYFIAQSAGFLIFCAMNGKRSLAKSSRLKVSVIL